MMKIFKILAVVAAVLSVSFTSRAQILYKIEKDGSPKVSYILGTHHLAPLAVVDSIESLPSILESIDRLYGELDMSTLNDPAVMLGMQKMLIAPSDSTIDKMLAPEQLDSVRNAWNEFIGEMVPFEMVKMMKPAVLSTQLASAMTMKNLPDLNPLEGIDMTMQNRARELGKPVAGLETMEFQMNMLYNTPIPRQVNSMMSMIRTIDEQAEQSLRLTNAYLNHDIQKIYELILQEEDDDPQVAEEMIYSRNDRWLEKLGEILPTESLMIVVGAGHLPGERGVLNGLRAKGFIVTPIV